MKSVLTLNSKTCFIKDIIVSLLQPSRKFVYQNWMNFTEHISKWRLLGLTTVKNEKLDSLHVSATKFYRMEADGLSASNYYYFFFNYEFCEYVNFGIISWKIYILSISPKLKFES